MPGFLLVALLGGMQVQRQDGPRGAWILPSLSHALAIGILHAVGLLAWGRTMKVQAGTIDVV